METETPGLTGFYTRLRFLMHESKEVGLGLIPSSLKCMFGAYFVSPERSEPWERAQLCHKR